MQGPDIYYWRKGLKMAETEQVQVKKEETKPVEEKKFESPVETKESKPTETKKVEAPNKVEGTEYIIPLRREWIKVVRYKRTRRSVMTIKKFIARHMRVPERDLDKVKLDVYLNNELWFRGCKKPPVKIKVIAKRDGDVIRVELAEIPEIWKFVKARQDKKHKKFEKKKVEVKAEGKVDSAEKSSAVKTEVEKKEESEKAKSGELAQTKAMEKAAKAQKHVVKDAGPQIQRKALKK